MFGWVIPVVLAIGKVATFLNKLFTFVRERQLKEQGKEELRQAQNEANKSAEEAAKEIKKHVDSLSDDSVVTELSKYRRKDL
jgi:hypothetical protein